MPIAIDGSRVPEVLPLLPCGGKPRWDYGSGCSYRCEDCMAVIGSIGMPRECQEALEKERKTGKKRDFI